MGICDLTGKVNREKIFPHLPHRLPNGHLAPEAQLPVLVSAPADDVEAFQHSTGVGIPDSDGAGATTCQWQHA